MNKLVNACMIVKNSGDTVKMTLEFLKNNFEHIFIVYSESEDNTEEILQEYIFEENFHMYKREFDDFSSQWNYILNISSEYNKNWNLKIDADEIYENANFDRLVELAKKVNIYGFYFKRYNLQNDFNHYLLKGYPDWQIRLVPDYCRMNGALVDENFSVNGKILPWDKNSIIHFGHVRNEKALELKNIDRKKLAEFDNCDGKQLKEYSNWFITRNKLWKNDVAILPDNIQKVVNEYI